MTPQTPTPGQPLSEADVSLLQPGDWLRHEDGTVHRILSAIEGWVFVADWREPIRHFTFLGRPDQDGWIEGPLPVGVSVEFDPSNQVARRNNIAPRWRPHAPVSRPGDGVRADDAARVHAPEMERSAENQRPKTRDWRDLRLVRFDCTDLYQWRGKHKGSIFEDQASEVFALTPPAEPVFRPAGEGEAVARLDTVRRLMNDGRTELGAISDVYGTSMSRRDKFSSDLQAVLLRPAAPDAGGEWMPIETAPKDGTQVDLFYPESGRFTDATNDGRGWGREEWRGTHTVRVRPSGTPTHWRPLPTPPALQPGGER